MNGIEGFWTLGVKHEELVSMLNITHLSSKGSCGEISRVAGASSFEVEDGKK